MRMRGGVLRIRELARQEAVQFGGQALSLGNGAANSQSLGCQPDLASKGPNHQHSLVADPSGITAMNRRPNCAETSAMAMLVEPLDASSTVLPG